LSLEIPYEIEPRPDTGLTNAKLGIWLFLASEVMLFGGLFSAYIMLRVGADTWLSGVENHLSIPIATFNTLVLITSSVTVLLSWQALKQNNYKAFKLFMLLTLALAVTFLVVKGFEYNTKFSHQIYPKTSTFYAIYFTITGLHGIHVIGGVLVFAYHLISGAKLFKTDPKRLAGRIEVTGLYWHFVDLVWIFVFPIFYLL